MNIPQNPQVLGNGPGYIRKHVMDNQRVLTLTGLLVKLCEFLEDLIVKLGLHFYPVCVCVCVCVCV